MKKFILSFVLAFGTAVCFAQCGDLTVDNTTPVNFDIDFGVGSSCSTAVPVSANIVPGTNTLFVTFPATDIWLGFSVNSPGTGSYMSPYAPSPCTPGPVGSSISGTPYAYYWSSACHLVIL